MLCIENLEARRVEIAQGRDRGLFLFWAKIAERRVQESRIEGKEMKRDTTGRKWKNS